MNNLEKRPSHEMESTLLHEAVPGHHLQIARAQELKGLPRFRRAGWYVAYGEGWALYAESLGYEMGFYKDPYKRFGALVRARCCAPAAWWSTPACTRMGWTREQSIQLPGRTTPACIEDLRRRRDRPLHRAGPGRRWATRSASSRSRRCAPRRRPRSARRFDLRRFHNAVLDDGALPLTVLEARIDEWIAERKERRT